MIHLRLIVIALVCLAGAARAHADDAAAAASLFDEATRLYDAGSYPEACPKYEASLKLDPNLDTRGRLALCYEKLGRLASAWSTWREVRSQAKRVAGRERAAEIADKHVLDLEPRLARVTLTLDASAAAATGLAVSLDGTAFSAETFGTAVAIDRGVHRFEATAPGRVTWTSELEIADGEQRDVTIGPLEPTPAIDEPVRDDVPPDDPRDPPGETTRRPPRTRAWIGLGAIGAGAIALGVGVWAGLDARGLRDDARALGCSDDLTSCPEGAAYDTARDAHGRGNLSTGLVVAGGVLAAAGVVLWLTAPDAGAVRVAPDVGPDHAGVAIAGGW